MRKLTTEEFIGKARKVHGDKYDYSKVDYVNGRTKVSIVCPTHGEFWQLPKAHLQGQRCKLCGFDEIRRKALSTTEGFVEKAKQIHNGKYNYSKVSYINSKSKICIICPIHGEFYQKPNDHLNGCGCSNCGGKMKMNTQKFITKSIDVHGDKYTYTKANYVNSKTKVCIICNKHGKFYQTPNSHLDGHGCPKCNCSKLELELRKFLSENNIEFKEQYKPQWIGIQSLDFYLPQYKIGIECQGEQHFQAIECFGGEERFKTIQKLDKTKLQRCKDNGVTLLYYSNLGVDYPYYVFEDKEELLEEIKRYG